MYRLFYWPSLQGRGEFVRLALEEADAPYRDVARLEGVPALLNLLGDRDLVTPSFAPPILQSGRIVIAQTANILFFLGERHGLAPKSTAPRLWVNQLQLTVTDLVAEVHDAHHPISTGKYYEQQKPEARLRTRDLLSTRVPKYLGYFNRVIDRNPSRKGWLVGGRLTYVDLSLFQVVEGLRYAFPKRMEKDLRSYPHLLALHAAVAKRPRIAAYLGSDRRIAFNTDGIFRHYPELDR